MSKTKIFFSTIITGLILLLASDSYSMFGVKISSGYGLGTDRMLYPCYDTFWGTFFSPFPSLTIYKPNGKTYFIAPGGGFKGNIDFLMALTENLELSLGTGIFFYTNSVSWNEFYSVDSVWEQSYHYTAKFSFYYLPITLSLTAKVRYGRFTPYCGLGMGIYVPLFSENSFKKTGYNKTWYSGGLSFSEQYNSQFIDRESYKVAFGIHGLAGSEFAISSSLSIFAEVKVVDVAFKYLKIVRQNNIITTDEINNRTTTDKTKLTIEFTENSADVMYRSTATTETDANGNQTTTGERYLKVNYWRDLPASSISFLIGIIFRF